MVVDRGALFTFIDTSRISVDVGGFLSECLEYLLVLLFENAGFRGRSSRMNDHSRAERKADGPCAERPNESCRYFSSLSSLPARGACG